MKKITFIVAALFVMGSIAFAEGADIRTGFRQERSLFEIGVLNSDIGLSNSWFSVSELIGLLKDKTIDGDEFLKKGKLNAELGFWGEPLSAKIKIGSSFTFSIVSGIEADFNGELSDGTMNSVREIKGLVQELEHLAADTSSLEPGKIETEMLSIVRAIRGLNGNLAAEGEAFAHLRFTGEAILGNRLWLKAGPSLYAPLIYIPRQSIGLQGEGTDIGNDPSKIWGSSFSLKNTGTGTMNAWLIENTPDMGLDFTLEGRFALFSFFDLGASLDHLPVVPAMMKHKEFMKAAIDFSVTVPKEPSDQVIDLIAAGGVGAENYLPKTTGQVDFDMGSSATDVQMALRPMRFNFYGIVKPFSSRLLLLRPELGFSIKYVGTNSHYTTFNWGIEGQLNLPMIFSVTLGTRLFEDVWSNHLGLIFDFRIFELDLGVAFRGSSFQSSWQGKGLGAMVGFKFGW